jgi:tectonin beta-propeller repeat-containing protein 1
MLPTDRWSWSTKDGTKKAPKDSFILPENWQWEDDWYIDPTVPGDEQVQFIVGGYGDDLLSLSTMISLLFLLLQGWQYALDFPREYGPVKEWKSCVRRRCWSRYRRFVKMEKWIKVKQCLIISLLDKTIL